MTGFFFPEAGRNNARVADETATTDGVVVLAIVDATSNIIKDSPDTLRIFIASAFSVVLGGALVLAATRLKRSRDPFADAIAGVAQGLIDDITASFCALIFFDVPEASGVGVAKLVVGVSNIATLRADRVVDPLAVRADG